MRTIKKILSSMLALAMLVGVFAPYTAFAEDALTSKDPKAVTNTVTLHKLVMTTEELASWPDVKNYDGTQNLDALKKLQELSGRNIEEVANVYFALKFASDYGDVSKNGKYVKAQVGDKNSPSDPLDATENIDEAVGGLTQANGIVFQTSKLKGKFEIVEVRSKSTYVGKNGETLADSKAVPVKITLPLVNENGTVLNAHVYPKNTENKPEIDKNFAKKSGEENKDFYENLTDQLTEKFGADYKNYAAEKETVTQTVGTKIPYEVKTSVKAGTEYGKLVWKDSMTNGLTFNNDVVITADNGVNLDSSQDYKIVQDDRGFVLSLTQSGLDKVKAVTKPNNESGKDVEFTIKYSATLNGTAIVDNPEKNDIYLEYGNKPGNEIEENEVTPSNKELTVTKNWADGTAPDGVSVTYVLKKDGQNKAAVTLDKSIKSGTTFDLGNGIKFNVTGEFSGKFTGLEDTNGWKISERVAGYTPSYSNVNAGTVTVTNKKDTDNPPPLNPTEPKIVTGGKKFVKTDNSENPVRLAGAKFVVKKDGKYLASKSDQDATAEQTALVDAKTALDAAVKAYNERKDDSQEAELKNAISEKQAIYNEAFKKASIKYEWVSESTAQNVITLVSNKDGQFEISGLEYGEYKLEEIEAPKGFAKIDDIPFLVSAKGQDSVMDIKYKLEDESNNAQKVVNKKVTIPQTGGIGTIIFTVAGLALMLGAAYAIKKNREEA